MNKKCFFSTTIFTLLLIALSTQIYAAPTVSNITASQRTDGSCLVDVYYNLSGGSSPMTVSVVFSNDNGATWSIQPAADKLTGDVGSGITNGSNKHIVWDAGRDKPGVRWTQTGVKVIATDSSSGPETLTIYLPGNVPMEFVKIPHGSFQMGSPDTERGRDSDEGPVHTVTINYDFYIGKYEITQGQWKALMGTNPVTDLGYTQYGVGDNYPVYYVSWNDINNSGGFIDKLNQHISSTNQGPANFRLPSEAEWEYSCRAGTSTRFYFGDSLGCADYDADCEAGTLPGNRSDYMWYYFNYNTPTYGCKPVGQKLPNQFGLYDMSGNLWEWCQDWYHSSYSGAPTNGSSWESPTGSSRLLRGGSWDYYARYCRSAYRYYGTPDDRYYYIGGRLLWTH